MADPQPEVSAPSASSRGKRLSFSGMLPWMKKPEASPRGATSEQGETSKGPLETTMNSMLAAFGRAQLAVVNCMVPTPRPAAGGSSSTLQAGTRAAEPSDIKLEVGGDPPPVAETSAERDRGISAPARLSVVKGEAPASGEHDEGVGPLVPTPRDTSASTSYRRSRSNSAVSIQAAVRGLISRELKSQVLAEHRSSIKRGFGDVVIETIENNGGACMLQAGGHPNTFKRDEEDPAGILVKEGTSHEKAIYEALQAETLREFTPRYHGHMENGALTLLRLGDETAKCKRPCVMDIKLGTRTFVESEVEKLQPRRDLAVKIKAIDPDALAAEEDPDRGGPGVTKLRYMQFRDATSSSATLGFRVEGIRVEQKSYAECKQLRTPQQLVAALSWYVSGREALRRALLEQLLALRDACEHSEWLFGHELVRPAPPLASRPSSPPPLGLSPHTPCPPARPPSLPPLLTPPPIPAPVPSRPGRLLAALCVRRRALDDARGARRRAAAHPHDRLCKGRAARGGAQADAPLDVGQGQPRGRLPRRPRRAHSAVGRAARDALRRGRGLALREPGDARGLGAAAGATDARELARAARRTAAHTAEQQRICWGGGSKVTRASRGGVFSLSAVRSGGGAGLGAASHRRRTCIR